MDNIIDPLLTITSTSNALFVRSKSRLADTPHNTKTELLPEVLTHIGKMEHIRRKEEIERSIKNVPQGVISVLQHWSQYLDDNSTFIV